MTVAQRGGDGSVTAGDPTVFADPLNGRSTLVLREPQLTQIKLLPWGHAGGTAYDHPPVQPPGGRSAEAAVPVENHDR